MMMQGRSIRVSELSEQASACGSYIRDAGNSLRKAGDYHIKVIGGFHSGAEIFHKPGELQIGSGKDNHLILFADEVASTHLQLSMPSSMVGKVRVSPIERHIALEDGSVVEVGQYAEIEDGESIAFGTAKIEISRIGNPKNFIKPVLRLVAVVCMIAMIPVLYNLFSGMVTGAVGASASAIQTLQKQVTSATNGYLHTSYREGQPATDAYLWSVRTKLEELKLNFRLRASHAGPHSLRVSGSILDAELPSWNAFLQWYDSKTGFPSLIRDVRRSDIENDLPQIKSVWLDDRPTVFFRDGTTANIGSRLSRGWTVIAIEASSVTIERDGAKVSLTY